jgi:hypothetical protein
MQSNKNPIWIIETRKSSSEVNHRGYFTDESKASEAIDSTINYWTRQFKNPTVFDLDGNYGKMLVSDGGLFVRCQLLIFEDQAAMMDFSGSSTADEIRALKGISNA